jgi:hypothetical protein
MPQRASPPSRYALDLAIAQLKQALTAADLRDRRNAPVAEPPALEGADAALVEAVRQNDVAGAGAALKSGANANVQHGLPLKIAAENKNERMMRELAVRGADVSFAIQSLNAENRLLSARTLKVGADDPAVREALRALLGAINPHAGRVASDTELGQLVAEINRHNGGGLMPAADEARRLKNDATARTLKEWQARFLDNLSPLEILRQQQKILDELEALKKDLMPQKLNKPKLAAPKPKQGG